MVRDPQQVLMLYGFAYSVLVARGRKVPCFVAADAEDPEEEEGGEEEEEEEEEQEEEEERKERW